VVDWWRDTGGDRPGEAFAPHAYVIDDTGFPKDGKASPLVARMYSGTLGKTANCQIGVSVQLVTDAASGVAHWRLFCPESWDDTTIKDPAKAQQIPYRRTRAGVRASPICSGSKPATGSATGATRTADPAFTRRITCGTPSTAISTC
jgi:hypothetical protein